MNGSNVVFTWSVTSNDNGSTVTGYRLTIFDQTNYVESDSCNSSMSGTTCEVPMSELTQAVVDGGFGYSPNDLILAKVEALNSEGYSTISDANSSGEVAQTVPD